MKKPTSSIQIAPSRRNAIKSAGPCTAQGKAIAKQNALKHSVLLKDVLVESLVLKECESEITVLPLRYHERVGLGETKNWRSLLNGL